MKFNVQTTLIVGLCGLVAWQSWSLSDVNDRLDAIEASGTKMTAAAKSTASEARGKRGRRANRQRGFEAQSPSASMRTESPSDAPVQIMPESEDAIRDVVSQQIEQRDAQKRQERIEKWTNRATERFQDQVSTIAEEYNVDAATQEQVVDALVDSMQQGFAIRKDVSSGELSYKDAKLEGAALKEDTAAAVADMIGEDAAEALWDEMESKGGRF